MSSAGESEQKTDGQEKLTAHRLNAVRDHEVVLVHHGLSSEHLEEVVIEDGSGIVHRARHALVLQMRETVSDDSSELFADRGDERERLK